MHGEAPNAATALDADPPRPRALCVLHTFGETQTLEARGGSVTPGADASQRAARHFAGVKGRACRIQRELSNSHELSTLPLCVGEQCNPQAPKSPGMGKKCLEWHVPQRCKRVGSELVARAVVY